jgi:hypothetical protein
MVKCVKQVMAIETRTMRLLLGAIIAIGLSGCATAPPKSTDNICSIFKEKSGWYKDAKSSESKWHSPIPIMMSIMYQESGFNAKAKPPRTKILWIFPGPRPSSSFGYSQAKKEAWKAYQKDTGHGGADRDDFDDAIDFIGWYNNQSHRRNGIPDNDAYNLYLAYHEGQGGYEKKTYKSKKWLLDIAKQVSIRSAHYDKQLADCRKELEGHWWWPF